jgi:hypothetical protein
MKKKILVCKNDNYNGSKCPRCLIKQNFLEFPAYEFAIEGVETNCDTCGSVLNWEFIDIKKPINIKLIAVIVGGIIILAGISYFAVNSLKSSGKKEKTETVKTVSDDGAKAKADADAKAKAEKEAEKIRLAAEENAREEEMKRLEEEARKLLEEKRRGKSTNTTTTSTSQTAGKQTLNVNGGTYIGETQNGRPHGMGTIYYKQNQVISPKDLKKRTASAGDYLIGEFYEGNPVQGKLFGASNQVKETIIIGR